MWVDDHPSDNIIITCHLSPNSITLCPLIFSVLGSHWMSLLVGSAWISYSKKDCGEGKLDLSFLLQYELLEKKEEEAVSKFISKLLWLFIPEFISLN